MEIQYLGTAAGEGWPALFCDCDICRYARKVGGRELRTRTQALIDGKLLIDFPPDTYEHALKHTLQLGKIKNLLITHSHMDHFFPVELIHRHEHFGHKTEGVLHVYGNETTQKIFYDAVLIDRFQAHPLDDVVTFTVVEPFVDFTVDGYHVIPVAADHDKREKCLIYIIEKNDKCMLYGHDTGVNLSEQAWECIFNHQYDLISLDATMGWKQTPEYHMGIPNDIEFSNRLKEKGCLKLNTKIVINHFSHNGEMTHEQLELFAKEHGMIAAYDGMKVLF
ncbi:MAG: MBL fold metallo-hydrolase [Lachnospiraceae bacterium]|nr:MBL fold metallo-hydrolase [Lachnospiraceae bacterium]